MRRTFLFLLGGLAAGFAAFGITTLVLQMDDAGAQGEPRVEERVETLDAAEARSGMDVATPLVVPEEFERTGIFVSALLDGAAATEVSQWWASPADGDSGMLLIQTPATGSSRWKTARQSTLSAR